MNYPFKSKPTKPKTGIIRHFLKWVTKKAKYGFNINRNHFESS